MRLLLFLSVLLTTTSPSSAFVAPQSTVSSFTPRNLPSKPSPSSSIKFSAPTRTKPPIASTQLWSSLPPLTAYLSAARPILTRLAALFLASFWAAQKFGRQRAEYLSQCPFLFKSSTSSTPIKGFYAWILGLFGRRPTVTIANNQTLVEQINQLEFVQTLAYSNTGLLNTADGNRHAYLRRLLSQAFSPSAMKGAVPRLQQVAEETLENVVLDPSKALPHFGSVLVHDASLQYTLDAIQCQWMGISLHREDRPVTREILKTYITNQPNSYSNNKFLWPWQRNPSQQAEVYLKNRLENLIDVKKRRPDESTLAYLLQAVEFTDYAAQSLTDAEVRDNTLTLIQAGARSSSSFLTTAIQLLGRHPQVYQKLVQEQRQQQTDYKLKHETIDPVHSPYLDAVVQEVLRLGAYTLPPRTPRIVTEDIELDNGKRIPTGWLVQCEESSTSNTNTNNNNNSDDEEEFIPERWLSGTDDDNNTTTNNNDTPSPFGNGPRACLGQDLAILQIKVFLAIMARRIDSFRVTFDADRINVVSQNSSPIKKKSFKKDGVQADKFTTTATSSWLMEALETSPSSFA